MQTPERKVYLPIMGGLGNQLFQVHAAASVADNIKIVIDSKLFNTNSQGYGTSYQEIYRVDNDILSGTFYRFRWITRRISGVLLRINSYPQHRCAIRLIGSIFRFLGRFFFSLRYGERVELVAPTTVGFETIKQKSSNSLVLIGYFQSDLYVNEMKLAKSPTNVRSGNGKFSIGEVMSDSTKEVPLVVHIRLGDYSTNPQIGMLDARYYLDNLAYVYEKTACSKLWLFSNDVERALEFIPVELRSVTLVKESTELNDSDIFELMSRGHAYFLANSTFSWWAARMSTANPSNIFAPKPWFAKMPEPYELIPKDWNRIDSVFTGAV